MQTIRKMMFLFTLCLTLGLVGCSSATVESYSEEFTTFSDGFMEIQNELISVSNGFAIDPLDSDNIQALQTVLKSVSTQLRKGEKLTAPSELKDTQESFGVACIDAANSVDAVVTMLNKGLTESTINEFNQLYTTFNEDLTKFGTEYSKVASATIG